MAVTTTVTAAAADTAPLRFAGWEIRPVERQLLVDGQPQLVGSRAFDVLLALVQRQGGVVLKRELLDLAWPGLVVEENNISVQIATLRKLLGAQVISTVAGVGYRLSAAPCREAAAPAPAAPGAAPAAGATPAPIGRDDDLQALARRLAEAPLLSIVGSGGVGKTVLARALAAHCGARFRDGVHWLDLNPWREGTPLLPLLGKALGIELDDPAHAREDLYAALAPLQALVVLDNCEHLLPEAAALVEDALQAAPGLVWLATSQAPLRVDGERIYRLEPLAVPAEGTPLAPALQHGALALLCQRATAADRHFRLDAAQLPLAIELCRQLDGLPLAIELAAAHVATLGLAAVQQQLGQRLRWMAAGRRGQARHHSLHSTLDWSHSLLTADEQRVFRRLAPFPASFDVGLAQALVSDGPDDAAEVLNLLSALVEKSLVQRQAGEAPRFFLFRSAREYAALQLAAAGETDRLRHRHAEGVADWFDGLRAQQQALGDAAWHALTAPERDNVRSALQTACHAGDAELLARLTTAAAQVDKPSQRASERLQWDIPLPLLLQATPARRATACLELGYAHYADGSRETGTELVLRALEDFRALGDTAGRYRALAQLIRLYESRPGLLDRAEQAWTEFQAIDPASVPLRTRLAASITAGFFYERLRSVERMKELEALSRRAGHDGLAALCRAHITDQLLVQRHFPEAAAAAQHYLDQGEPPGRARALILLNQAIALIQLDRPAEAHAPALAALRILPGVAYVVVDAFALGAARASRLDDAALLAGYGERVRRERDERPDPAEAALIEETLARLEASLPTARLAELMQIGGALSTAEALAMLLPPAAALPGPASLAA